MRAAQKTSKWLSLLITTTRTTNAGAFVCVQTTDNVVVVVVVAMAKIHPELFVTPDAED